VTGPFKALKILGEEEYNRRVREERRPPPPGGVLLVGERANNDGFPSEHDENPLYCISRGAFLWGPSRDRLTGLGLRWDAAMNMLHAQPTRRAAWGPAEREKAARVMQATLALAAERGWRLVLLGERVCASAGVEYEPLAVGRYREADVLISPHPSGLCRWWNERENVRAAERMFRAATGSSDWGELG
jgi:hypothetical protein